MVQRYIVKAAACLEIAVGAIFIIAPNIPCALLFGANPDNIGTPLARWVGVSLFALSLEVVTTICTLYFVAIPRRKACLRCRRGGSHIVL